MNKQAYIGGTILLCTFICAGLVKMFQKESQHLEGLVNGIGRAVDSFKNGQSSWNAETGANQAGECRLYSVEFIRDLRRGKLQQNDPKLIQYIRDRVLVGPASRTTPYNLTKPDQKLFSQKRQDEIIDGLLKQKRNGFFVESGAFDGELHSNTLFFERERNWSGLLVEVNPKAYSGLSNKNRKAYSVEACLSPSQYTSRITLTLAGEYTTKVGGNGKGKTTFIGQCYPLWSILQALGIKHIDMYSLDVEGMELDILKTIPFDEVQIDIFTIEYNRFGDSPAKQKQNAKDITTFLEATGKYTFHQDIGNLDILFIHKNFKL